MAKLHVKNVTIWDTGEQARQFAFGQVRDVVSEQVNQQLESWLSARAAPA
ncbi:hypothetical protein KCP75_06330 [Salmonella enterica subsp. enterica]|nr:hypothetical protein KCP75_06330 [Salmonella enterica subsp. enterica]